MLTGARYALRAVYTGAGTYVRELAVRICAFNHLSSRFHLSPRYIAALNF